MNQIIIKQRIERINRGEVPEGYKRIVNSVVPSDWEQRSLGKLFDFYGGLGKSRDELGEIGVPYLHYGDMHRNTFTKVSYEQYLSEPKYDTVITGQETFLLNDGDVVFLDASEDLEGTTRTVMVDNPENQPFISGLHTIVGKSKKNYLQKEFKKYITEPFYIRKQFMRLASGFKVYGLNRETIKKIEFAYPKNINEQQKIAKILSKWDEAVFLQEKLIEKLEVQKKALMQKILVPNGEWEKVAIRDLFEITRGQVLAVSECKESYKYPVYSSQTTNNGLMGYYYDSLFEDAITWTTDGANAGKVMYRTGKFYCTNVCGVLLSYSGYANSCFAYLLNEITPNYVSYVGNPKLMNNVMASIQICIPPLDFQRKVSVILNLFENKVELQMKKFEKLKLQQESMQQLLLTGIIRVN